jgi:hypothetical protein
MSWTIKDALGVVRSFGFRAPDGATLEKNEVLFPWSEVQSPAFAATLAVTIKQMLTILKPGTLTGAVTLNLTIDSQVTTGAKLVVKVTADGTNRVLTFGTGFDAASTAITVTASTCFCRTFIFDGTAFVPCNQ